MTHPSAHYFFLFPACTPLATPAGVGVPNLRLQIHPSKMKHGGGTVTAGTRYILVGFLEFKSVMSSPIHTMLSLGDYLEVPQHYFGTILPFLFWDHSSQNIESFCLGATLPHPTRVVCSTQCPYLLDAYWMLLLPVIRRFLTVFSPLGGWGGPTSICIGLGPGRRSFHKLVGALHRRDLCCAVPGCDRRYLRAILPRRPPGKRWPIPNPLKEKGKKLIADYISTVLSNNLAQIIDPFSILI